MVNSYTSQEPWPQNCESPKESVQWLSQDTSKIMQCGHIPSSVVWSHMWSRPSTKCYFNEFLYMQVLTHDGIKETNNNERSECRGLPVLYQTYLQKVVFENSPSDHETWSVRCIVGIQVDFTSILHSHAPRWSLKHSVKRTWTGSTFSTNESAWSEMVTGSQSRVWSGPNLAVRFFPFIVSNFRHQWWWDLEL